MSNSDTKILSGRSALAGARRVRAARRRRRGAPEVDDRAVAKRRPGRGRAAATRGADADRQRVRMATGPVDL